MNPAEGQTEDEEQIQLEAFEEGTPFVVFRDGGGEQTLIKLTGTPPVLALGSGDDADVILSFDPEISRLHLELAFIGGEWLAIDDGISDSGTFVNDKLIQGRKRLRDRDLIRIGETGLLFRNPADPVPEGGDSGPPDLTDVEKRVLVSLCRPFRKGTKGVLPATNRGIADELSLSADEVQHHLRKLTRKFELDDQPENRRRIALVVKAFKSGAVTPADIRD